MNKRELFKKSVAWLLIATMVNPALMAPAFARDSDIYLASTSGTSTAEPNVLFILGTNDRMNVAEAWREYDPLVYDSHAEYLWNDINIISPLAVPAENANAISTVSPPVNPFSPWGTWSGALPTDRTQLWQATLAYAQGTQASDPGPRTTYRNYWLGSWYYWLPTGTPTTDSKLWSVSFNRFLGFVQTVFGARGGVTFPATTANYTGANDFRSSNACTTSFTQLEPSTIFAPTTRAQNAGFMLNQQWVRWEPYLGLQAINNPAVNYPGNNSSAGNTSSSPSVTTFLRGYVDGISGAPTNTATPTEPTNVYRDSTGGNIGSQGLPIRRQFGAITALPAVTAPTVAPNGTRSYAGWSDPKADLGGFVFQSWVAASGVNYYYPQSVLANLRGIYGYGLGAAGLAYVPAGSLANEQFSAWLGNRDGAPAFGSTVGTPGYYDVSQTAVVSGVANNGGGKFRLTVTSSASFPTGSTATVSGILGGGATAANGSWTVTNVNATTIDLTGGPAFSAGYTSGGSVSGVCNPASGPTVANKCIQFASGASTYAIRQVCTPMGSVKKETDASGTLRYTQSAAACNPTGSATCTVNGVTQPMSTCTNPPASLTAPVCSLLTTNTFLTAAVATNCSYGAGTTVNVGACGWSGRQSVYIEGQGTYFYGGTCGENGYNWGQPNASCTVPNGAAPYSATKTLNSVSQANVLGPYASPPPATGLTTLGCGNSVAPGTYRYGGTCTGGQVYQMPTFNNSQVPGALPSPPVPNATVPGPAAARQLIGSGPNPVGTRAAICAAPSGGAAINIRNMGVQTYNRTCNNNYPNVGSCLGWYGTQCQPNSTPSGNCQTPVTNSVAAGSTAQWYQAYLLQATNTAFTHECLADSPTGNTPNGYPTQHMRTFTQGYNTGATADSANNLTQGYTTNPAQGVTANPAKNIDVYSTNYLNFLYGAKACRDAAGALVVTSPVNAVPAGGVCNPIARKTRLQVAKDALSNLVNTTDGVRLGLMVYNKTDTSLVDDGGNIAYAIRRMGSSSTDLPGYNNRASLSAAIQAVTANSRTPLTESLYEAYRYFAGRTPVWGLSAANALVAPNPVSSQKENTVGTVVDPVDVYANVYVTNGAGKYNSPMLFNPNVAGPANCQKNYIVMITNGQPEDDDAANAAIKTMVYAASTGATVSPRTDFDTAGATPNNAGAPDYRQIPTVAGGNPYGPTDAAGTAVDGGYVWLDELTYYMSQADVSPGAANFQSEYTTCANPVAPGHTCNGPTTTDLISGRQSIITYTIGFAGISAPVVQNAALVSGGIYYVAQNAQQLQAALQAAFVAIRNWNPTAAAATVPISSLNRGESSHDVYLAFFGPSVASAWPGTVKKYQISTLATDCGTNIPLCLIGQTQINGLYNIQTVDPVTGVSVVDPTAVSGANDLNHPPGSAWQASTVQDGALPTKGGTGHVLINTAGYTPDMRKIYTYLTDSVTLYTNATKSTTTDLTNVTNAADYVTNSSNVTRCRLGDSGACNGSATMSFATKDTLMSFIRGGNLGDSSCTDGSTGTLCSTWSTWPHAAVEHSKPVIVNYNSSTTPPVQYMYYLQNNGMLTAVDTNTGREKWSFLIEEALPKIASLQANVNGPEIYVADGSPTVYYDDANGDGIINGTDRVWLYFGLRRGGRAYYALDITLKDQPFFKWKITAEQPSLSDGTMSSGSSNLFVGYTANFAVGMTVKVAGAGPSGADLTANITGINGGQNRFTLSVSASTSVANARIETVGTPLSAKVCNASSTCASTPAYNELGQSWSTPNVVKLKALFGVANSPPALIFGGGYDPAEDSVPAATRTMGRAVFIVNGNTGSTNDGIVRSFGAGQGNIAADFRSANMMSTYSVPSDVTAINTDFDSQNYVDRLYVGDMGGNVWRIDVDDAVAGNWKGELLASLSNAAGEKRKFFFPPAVAPQDKPFNFHAVYIGSGDKEHPLLTGSTVPPTTDDRIFMLMDDPTLNSGGGTPDTTGPSALATPIVLGTLVDIADISSTGADATSLVNTANSLKGRQGWSRRLLNGEKVINATTVFRLQAQISRLRFGTYAPLVQLNACTPPGEGRLNEIDSLTGNLIAINGAAAGAQRFYTGFLSRGYMSSTQLLILPSGGVGSTKVIYQFNCADANCQGTQIGTLGAPTKIYWYLEPEQ